jgi:hypothetical protein
MSRSGNKEQFVAKAHTVHGPDAYDYSETVYVNNKSKIRIGCKPCLVSFDITPSHHLKGNGCKDCTKKAKLIIKREEFFAKVRVVHGPDTFDYSQVVYTTSETKVKIGCKKCLKFFEQTPHSHLSGKGCPCICMRITKEDFVTKARTVHGPDAFNYDEVIYVGTKTKVKIRCNDCMVYFDQFPLTHTQGHGCRACSYISMRNTKEDFVTKARTVHGPDAFNYDEVVYVDTKTKVKIRCNDCMVYFDQSPLIHTLGYGCRACANFSKRDTQEEFVAKANRVHSYKYDYCETVYIDAHSDVTVVCRDHGPFELMAASHVRGRGCPGCRTWSVSKAQIEWLGLLAVQFGRPMQSALTSQGEFKIGTYWADGYDETTKTVAEMNGCFFHGCERCYTDPSALNSLSKRSFGALYEYTLKREQFIRDQGYSTIVMWEHTWKCLRKVVIRYQRALRARIASKNGQAPVGYKRKHLASLEKVDDVPAKVARIAYS